MRFMRYFSIITAAATSLTILPVFDGITVYHAIVSSHYMPCTIVIIVLCRDIWRKIKVDEEKLKSHPRILPCSVVEHMYK